MRRNARRASARRPGDGRLARVVGELDETIVRTHRLLWQAEQRLAPARISHLKRAFGLRRTRLRRLGGASLLSTAT